MQIEETSNPPQTPFDPRQFDYKIPETPESAKKSSFGPGRGSDRDRSPLGSNGFSGRPSGGRDAAFCYRSSLPFTPLFNKDHGFYWDGLRFA